MRKHGADRTSEVPGGDVDGWFDRHQMHVLRASLIALFVMMVLGGIYISHEMLTLSQRASDNAQAVTSLSKNLDTSRKQLTDHGITPSAPPAKTVVEQVGGTPGAAGSPGKNGTPGNEGPVGPSGSPGPTGKPGSTGKDGSPGATGPTGAAGTNGIDGSAGDVGPAGPAGQDGKNGTDGANGKDGKDGKDGAPPAGWTYTDPSGQSYTCAPVSDFDASAPRYACTADTAAAPSASNAAFQTYAASSSPSRQQDTPMMMSAVYAIVSERKRL